MRHAAYNSLQINWQVNCCFEQSILPPKNRDIQMAACKPSYRKYFVVDLECAETSGLGNPDPS